MMKVITFFSAKGGTGKTTFNMLFASYLSYQLGKRVMVVDLDVPEYNLTNCRERELAYLKEKELPCDPDSFYAIEAVEDTSETNIRALAAIIRGLRDKLDYLILDFKGSFKSGDPVLILAEENVIDKVIMPMELDPMVIASVKSLSRVFQDNGQQPRTRPGESRAVRPSDGMVHQERMQSFPAQGEGEHRHAAGTGRRSFLPFHRKFPHRSHPEAESGHPGPL